MARYVTIRGSDNNLDGLRVIFAKISGTVRVDLEVLALKYGRTMEDEAVGSFTSCFSRTHSNV